MSIPVGRVPAWLGSVLAACIVFAAGLGPANAGSSPIDVLTYHYDALRTGWDPNETQLTPSAVAGASFKLLQVVALDDQVQGQPLVVSRQRIGGGGARDVVYVATMNNSVYAIDAASGATLLHVSLGSPVVLRSLPGQCVRDPNHEGVNGTPVIDRATHAMYLLAFTWENGQAVYRIHALDLSTLADVVPPVVVSAQHRLTDGTVLQFLAGASRQRAALLLAGGTVYAGFSGFCDIRSDLGRGWVLGWAAGSLLPLPLGELTDRQAASPNDVFLSEIWMSGYGIGADAAGNLFFATGNSDPSGTTYDARTNLAESVVKLAPRLARVLDHFTPSGAQFGVAALDRSDLDFGAGGVLLLPPQPGGTPNLAVAAGKVGQMYLLDRDHLGGYAPQGPDRVLGTYAIGPCFCGQSYFTGADGVGRVVSSGGSAPMIWALQTTPVPALTLQATLDSVPARLNDGFFTAISSDGTRAGSAVIWAASGPLDRSHADISLTAFDADSGVQLTTMTAGNWPNTLAHADTVPVVANGRVFVASYKQLAVFGLSSGPASARIARYDAGPRPALADDEHEVFGTVKHVAAGRLTLETRDGRAIEVDAAAAATAHLSVVPVVGHALMVRGAMAADGELRASVVLRVPDATALWPSDR